jgi:hypothetical protein
MAWQLKHPFRRINRSPGGDTPEFYAEVIVWQRCIA